MSRWNVAVCAAIAVVLGGVSPVVAQQAPQQPPPAPVAPPTEAPPPAPPDPSAPAADPGQPPAVETAPGEVAPPADVPQGEAVVEGVPEGGVAVEGEVAAEGEVMLEAETGRDAQAIPGEEIVVTGSRLRRTAFSTSAPVTVVKREELERSGYTTLADFVRSLSEGSGNTAGSGGVGTVGGSFYENQGVQMVNLRGLGANATLVLVNGRRLIANGPGGALESFSNLSTIPVAMIERIEILRGGASAIYGSDAIAGVVNVITRKKTDGVNVQANATTTDTFDTQEYEGNIVAGGSNKRSSFSVGLNWYHSTPLEAMDRDWTEGQYWSSIGPIGMFVPVVRTFPGGTPSAADIGYFELFPDPQCPDPKGFLHQDHTDTIAAIQARIAALPGTSDERATLERRLSAYQLAQRFQGNYPTTGSPLPYLADYRARGWWPESYPAGDPRNQQAIDWGGPNGFGCSWDFRRYKEIRPEMTRLSSMLSATHDVTDHFSIEIEAQYADNRTTSKTQPSPDFRDARIYPVNAFDVDSTPWTAPIMREDGTVVTPTYNYSLWYGYPQSYSTPPNYSKFDAQTFRAVLALKGDFEAAAANTIAETWDWELSGSYARSTWDARFDAFQTDYVQRALDACKLGSDGALGALPNTPGNRQRLGCFNPYFSASNDPDLANDPGLLRKLMTHYNNMTVTELYTGDATLRGELLPLPGGPLSFALGGQYRFESRSAVFDNDTNLNRTPFGGIDNTSKDRDVWSAYAELGVPILRAVELQPAVRYETYEDVGDAISPRVGLIVRLGNFFEQPPAALSQLALRGTYSRAFRAPNLAQTDPKACSYVSENTYTPRADPNPVSRRSTRTQLLNGRVCGADGLGPEEATSYSAGVEWNFKNLHFESDYWRYAYSERIIQPIIQRAIDRNADRAYCLLNPNADPIGQSQAALSFARTITTRPEYFAGIDCAAISRQENVAEKSLTPDQFIAKYPEVMYNSGTGNPEQGMTLVRYANASEVTTQGIDFGVSYSLSGRDFGLTSDIGTFSIGLKGSYVLDFLYREAPENPNVSCTAYPDDPSCEKDAAGKRNLMNFNDVMPRLRFSAPLTYQYRRHSFALIGRYVGGFKDDGEFYDVFNPPPPDVPAWTTFDFQYALDLSGAFGTPANWRIGVQNIFDRDPPRIRQRDNGGFEPAVHDGRGRLFYTRIGFDL